MLNDQELDEGVIFSHAGFFLFRFFNVSRLRVHNFLNLYPAAFKT